MTVFGTSDLFARRELDGRVIRIRRESDEPAAVAVDDGTQRRVRAWRVTPQIANGLAQGADVHVRYTPRLGCVLSREITEHAPVDPSAPVVATSGPTGAGGPVTKLEGVDASWVSSVVGVPVHDTTDLRDSQLQLPVAIGPARVAMLGGDDGTRVVLGRTEAVSDYQQLIRVLPKLLRRSVDGVGEEAVWLLQSMLLAHDGDTTGLVMVAVRDLDPDARLAAARQLATWLLA
jgi:hypothetical protein